MAFFAIWCSSKLKKIKNLNYYMNLTIHLSVLQREFKMQIIKPFSSIAELPKLYNSYFKVHMHMYFFLAKSVETLCKMNPTVFISLLDTCTSHQHSLLLAYWWVRKDWNKKELRVALFFSLSFSVLIFGTSDGLTEGRSMSGKDDKVSWSFMFLRTPLSSFPVRSKFWFRWKAWPPTTVSVLTRSVRM